MTDETMTQFKTEGSPAFPVKNEENDNSAAPSAGEKTNTDQTQSQAGDQNAGAKKDDGTENFADHPRWKERETDWTNRFNEQETRHVSEIQRLREDFETKIAALGKPQGSENATTSTQVPSWFGGDEQQWQAFQEWNKGLIEQARTGAVKEIETKTAAESKAIEDATTYFTEQVTALESDKAINPQGEKIDRNKLLKFVLDNDLVDSKGRWNYRAGFQMMKAGVTNAKADSIAEKKHIAGATTSENRAETKPPAFTSSTDFAKPGNRPW